MSNILLAIFDRKTDFVSIIHNFNLLLFPSIFILPFPGDLTVLPFNQFTNLNPNVYFTSLSYGDSLVPKEITRFLNSKVEVALPRGIYNRNNILVDAIQLPENISTQLNIIVMEPIKST